MKIECFERIERFLLRLIAKPGADRGHGPGIRFLLWVLRQLSHLYGAIVKLRHWLFDNGIFRHHALGCQVISVGNLTVGGTGKTPVVEIIARELIREGRRVAILSRGYKKKEPGFFQKVAGILTLRDLRHPPRVVSDGTNLLLNSEMSGDEPYMLAANVPEACVLVDKNRVKSGLYAINKFGCDTLILDDGFQYLHLKHMVEIVLVDYTNPFGNGNVLPRGILREPVKHIKKADYIFITKSTGQGTARLVNHLRQFNEHAEIIECCHRARHLRGVFSDEEQPLEWLKDKWVVAVSGIAAPRGFELELEKHGAVLLEKFRFADHHRYSQQEIINMINDAVRLKAKAIITTEKDAVRFPELRRVDVPIYYLRVDIEMLRGVEDFKSCISRICFRDNALLDLSLKTSDSINNEQHTD